LIVFLTRFCSDAVCKKRILAHEARVWDAALLPGGAVLTASEDGTCKLVASDGQIRATVRGHRGSVRRVAVTSDGEWLASGADDGSVRLWKSEVSERNRFWLVNENHTGTGSISFGHALCAN